MQLTIAHPPQRQWELQNLKDRSDALRAITATEKEKLETQREMTIFFKKKNALLDKNAQWVKLMKMSHLSFKMAHLVVLHAQVTSSAVN